MAKEQRHVLVRNPKGRVVSIPVQPDEHGNDVLKKAQQWKPVGKGEDKEGGAK